MFFRDFNFFPLHWSPGFQTFDNFSTIFENEVLVDFFDFGRLDMLDIVYSDSTNYSRPLDNQ